MNTSKYLTHNSSRYEFVLTKRKGHIVSRRKWIMAWTPMANQIRKRYHETKHGVISKASLYKLPKEKPKKLSKEERYEKLPFSEQHYRIIDNAFGRRNDCLKRVAERAAHEIRIENMHARLKMYQHSLKYRYSKNCKYKIIAYYEDSEHKMRIITEKYVPLFSSVVHDTVNEWNKFFSRCLKGYAYTVVKRIPTNSTMCLFTREIL